MRRAAVLVLICMTVFLALQPARAFEESAFHIGLGYYSQNAMGKTTKSADGSASTWGAASIPVFVKFDYGISTSWFVSPLLSYTPIARASAGDSTETTILQLLIPFGTDLDRTTETVWDWQFGVGLNLYNEKGKGGVEVLSNGTSTSQFARPARSVAMQTYLFAIGTSLNYEGSRIGFDLIFEGLLSSKLSQSFLFSYAYRL